MYDDPIAFIECGSTTHPPSSANDSASTYSCEQRAEAATATTNESTKNLQGHFMSYIGVIS